MKPQIEKRFLIIIRKWGALKNQIFRREKIMFTDNKLKSTKDYIQRKKRNCLTCKWEPEWRSCGAGQYKRRVGQCRFPFKRPNNLPPCFIIQNRYFKTLSHTEDRNILASLKAIHSMPMANGQCRRRALNWQGWLSLKTPENNIR